MTFDGVTAVQARIAQIQQIITGTTAGVGGTDTTAGTSSSASSASSASSVTQSPEFSSLLADAMASGTTSSDPLSDSSSDSSSTSLSGSTMLNQLLSQMGSGGGTTGTAGSTSLSSSLLSSLTGSGSSSGLDASTIAQLLGSASTGGVPTTAATTGTSTTTNPTNPTTQLFVNNALAEQGKPYVYGATAQISDPNPPAFDCSELTKWASARAGVTIPDGATAQYLYIRDHGDTMTVQQALHTPGALLFHFGHEPKNLGDIPADGHVAISLGDGVHTIEARGHAYGTNVFDNASGRDFNFAGMIPGMS